MSQGLRIAMWSGPRNISTAMMRSFENRADCTVTDEPFYGCYLWTVISPALPGHWRDLSQEALRSGTRSI